VRRLATAADGHLYWDYLNGGTFAVETGAATTPFGFSPLSAEGSFTITGVAPGWKYALIAHAAGYPPTWLGDIVADDFAPSSTAFEVFAAPANGATYNMPVITLSAGTQSGGTPVVDDGTTPLPNMGDTTRGLTTMLLALLAALACGFTYRSLAAKRS
jgi:hypothetical protein